MTLKKTIVAILKVVKWFFIILGVYLVSLLFREERIPVRWVEYAADRTLPTNLVFHLDSMSVGLRSAHVRGFKLYDKSRQDALTPLCSAKSVAFEFFSRSLRIDELTYLRLPDSYYAPGNLEKNARVEAQLPTLPQFHLDLVRPHILGVEPEEVVARIGVDNNRFVADHIRLDWPDTDERLWLDGFCYVDLNRQEIYGEVEGKARQPHIRPLLVALDVPVSLPYMDGFTEVPGSVPSWCSWRVNLINNDFDLKLLLHPTLGKYNGVPMKRADGNIHLHVYTRGTNLNYRQTFGPIHGVGTKDQPLDGTVWVSGTNGYNTVDVDAKSALPVADLLRIGGFTGDYVGDDVFGNSACKLQFRFPRAMTNNYEMLDGQGHISISGGRVLRMKGFRGLVEQMAEHVPGFSYITDSTEASGDYVIEHGVVKTDNIYIEGTVFSIRMFGSFDAVKDKLDFNVHVQFTKKDSVLAKILHPLTWPFTKLLLEFRLTGSASSPQWSYLSVLDRVMETVK